MRAAKLFALSFAAALSMARGASPALSAAETEFFEAKIRPVLVESCYKCHSAQSERVKGGLLLDTRDGLLKGGETGTSIVPGDPEKSKLMVALRYKDENLQMPPKEPLPAHVVADFEKWIKMGAPDPRAEKSKAPTGEAAASHWAFQPVTARALPKVKDKAWAKTAIDAFILADLEERKLQPAPAADKATLLRRATFDLIGLPPSPEDLEKFLADASPDAFAKVVDRLLESASFGERWGRRWLDLARYADSNGLEINTPYPNAYRYRDYVIAAYNNDKPYNQFIREQLAGDLLEAKGTEDLHEKWIATGFLVIGPKVFNEPMREKLVADVIDEQIDVTTKAFLGMTVACARCHDHKFDPIPTKDYYALAGIFGSTATLSEVQQLRPGPNGAPWSERPLGTAEEAAAVEKHNAEVARMTAELEELRQRTQTLPGGIDSKELPGIVIDNLAAEVEGAWQKSVYSTNFVDKNYLTDGATDKGKKKVRFRPEIPEAGAYEIRLAYTPNFNRATNVQVTITGAKGVVKTNYLNQRLAPTFDKAFAYLGLHDLDAGTNNVVEISNAGTAKNSFVVVDAVQFLRVGEMPAMASMMAPKMIAGMKASDITLVGTDQAAMQDKLVELQAKAPPALPTAMAVRDAEVKNAKLAIRGDVQRLGDEVPRGFIRVIDRGAKAAPVFKPDASGRLELADWIASAENPLTARVYVNRVWQHLFGHGLVDTPDNFGLQGERPSNPDLLDYLAAQFVAEGWSTKKLIRSIMLTSAYQMSAKHNPAAFARDPDNRLIWRMARRRLEAEAFRDAMLAVSGKLDYARGGAALTNVNANPQALLDGTMQIPQITRRSVYLPILRNNVDDLLLVFDFADPHTPTGKRHITSAATQALYVMNSPFVQEQAKEWATRLLKLGADEKAIVKRAFVEAFTREPNSFELQRSTAFLNEFNEAAAQKEPNAEARRALAWQALCQALMASAEFRFLN